MVAMPMITARPGGTMSPQASSMIESDAMGGALTAGANNRYVSMRPSNENGGNVDSRTPAPSTTRR
jgi:hypothetical protein